MKSVVITGASKGIGAECAKVFAEKGFNVLINYNASEKSALSLRQEIKEKFPSLICEVYKCDVSNFADCEKMINFALSIFGKIDVLVANAGVSQQKLFIDTSEDDFNRVIGTNLKGVYNVTRATAPSMLSNKEGSVVAVSSIWGVSGAALESLYSASKAGVIGLCSALSKELGPSNILVNCVAPGAIETEMNKNLSKEEKEMFSSETSLGRFGSPREVAETILFLATQKYITGQTIVVDGGYLM